MRAVDYLESWFEGGPSASSDPYSLAVVTYALTLAGSPLGATAFAKLRELAIEQGQANKQTYTREAHCLFCCSLLSHLLHV